MGTRQQSVKDELPCAFQSLAGWFNPARSHARDRVGRLCENWLGATVLSRVFDGRPLHTVKSDPDPLASMRPRAGWVAASGSGSGGQSGSVNEK